MKFRPVLILLIVISLSSFAGGCRSVLTEKTLSSTDDQLLFETLVADPNQHIGKVITLGGEIIRLRPLGPKTEIEFAEIPLYDEGRPALGFDPGEHFFVLFPERVDATLFTRGKVVTIAGKVIGTRRVDGVDHPLLAHEEAHVWNQLREDRFPSYGALMGGF
ncbi:MAG: Slp family lipoprotein [Candidatus Manganitrophaceae bacterium]